MRRPFLRLMLVLFALGALGAAASPSATVARSAPAPDAKTTAQQAKFSMSTAKAVVITGRKHPPLVISVSTPQGRNYASFPWGQDTYWAAKKRPDLIRALLKKGIPGPLFTSGDWAILAKDNGFPVSTRPSVGAIVVFPSDTGIPGSFGHVAYVQALRAGGSFVISEMGWIRNSNASIRVISRVSSGVRFIGRLR